MDHAGFLTAIRDAPDDPAPRLIYADFLDDSADPRANLIRREEEMRTLPAFSDDYWSLKPERDLLKSAADPDWLAALGYHLPQPVFAHGWPADEKGQWRLLRAFVTEWHGIAMPDGGARGRGVAAAEREAGRTLPPAVREFVDLEARFAPVGSVVGPDYFGAGQVEVEGGRARFVVRFSGPPRERIRYEFLDPEITVEWAEPLAEAVRDGLLSGRHVQGSRLEAASLGLDLVEEARAACGTLHPFGRRLFGEGSGLLVWLRPREFLVEAQVLAVPGLPVERVPAFAWELCRRHGSHYSGVFRDEHLNWRDPDEPLGLGEGEIPF